MKRHEAKRKRDREQLVPALARLIEIIPPNTNARQFFQSHFVDGNAAAPAPSAGDEKQEVQEDLTIAGEGLQRLLDKLGAESCPEGAVDLLRVVRRVPRSRSTETTFQVAELCFAINQATGPVSVHERRRTAGMQTASLDEESTPVLQYYKGKRFREISGHGDSPAAARAEWESFIHSLETALPMTLRMHRSERALERLARSVLETGDAHPEVREVVRPVACLPAAAHLYSCTNKEYHANKQVEYVCRTLHAASAVSFQEVVSALPVLVLDLQPHHTALEMCAAPGSKTLQALDSMLQGGWSAAVSQGVFLSNEKDRVKATQTLPARLKRYHAPNVLSTRCDGTQWPRLYRRGEDGDTSAPVEQQFDRIICDVPCSGDGTIRKERSVATTWAPGYVQSLVPTQKALLRRGLDLLADDGILVYSTCSLNPKEDEEVVCAGLELFGDCVELIDVNAVLREKGAALHSAGGVLSPEVEGLKSGVVPPSYDGRKVLRVLPHRDDTGGFFVAAFRKVRQPDWSAPTVARHKLNQWTKGKLWTPVKATDEAWVNIATFYGFDPQDTEHFYYWGEKDGAEATTGGTAALVPLYNLNPNGGPLRRICLVTRGVAHMLFSTLPYKGPGLEVVSVGMRAFEAYDGKFLSNAACRWRAVVESASFVSACCHARKLHLCASEHMELLRLLFRDGFVLLKDWWRVLLGRHVLGGAVAGYPFIKGVQLREAMEKVEAGTMSVEDANAVAEAQLICQVEVGGVLLCVRREAGEEPWHLSATLSGSKLEMAIDGSLRAFGLMMYCGETAAMRDAAAAAAEDGGDKANEEEEGEAD